MTYLVTTDSMRRFEVGPQGSFAWIFNGDQHAMPSVSLMLSELQPGEGPAWHRHDYDEFFVVEAGIARFLIGEETVDAVSGNVVLVPATVPHSFTNPGESLLRLTAVHVASHVSIEWLDEPSG